MNIERPCTEDLPDLYTFPFTHPANPAQSAARTFWELHAGKWTSVPPAHPNFINLKPSEEKPGHPCEGWGAHSSVMGHIQKHQIIRRTGHPANPKRRIKAVHQVVHRPNRLRSYWSSPSSSRSLRPKAWVETYSATVRPSALPRTHEVL
jgi:hypothetical protein